MKKKIFIFGVSILGKIAFEHLYNKFDIEGFIDNDPQKTGKYIKGIEIFSGEILKNLKDRYVIISSMYDVEIASQLFDHGIKKFGVFEAKGDNFDIKHYDYSHIGEFKIIPNKISLLIENNSGSNTLAMVKKIPEKVLNKYDIVVIDKNKKAQNYYYDIITSKLILTTHDYRCNENQINIQLWHGVPLKGLSYMSKYEEQNKEANHIAWSKFDYIISYSQMYSTLLNSCYGVDRKKYKVLGMPRNDLLLNVKDSKENLANILNDHIVNKKVIFYLPTFRRTVFGEKNGEIIPNLNLFYDQNMHDFNAFLKENNIIFIAKMHPQENSNVSCLSNIFLLNEETLKKSNLDLYEILGSADVLITDYSSVYFDYLLLDRPIIFYTPDIDLYKEDRGFLLDPFDFWAPGEKCRDYESLKKAIINIINGKDDFAEKRKLVTDIIHQYRDNKSSLRVWNFVDSIMS